MFPSFRRAETPVRCSLLWFFLPLLALLLVVPRLASGYMTQVRYQSCREGCLKEFFPVVEGDGCEETVQNIHHDLIRVRDVIEVKRLCRGRYHRACRRWQVAAVGSLNRLISLTADSYDCRTLSSRSISQELLHLQFGGACKGDRTYTDLHDLMARRRSLIRGVNKLGPRYKFRAERLSRHPEYRDFLPRCERGKPLKFYVWPLFEFSLSLYSLVDLQECSSRCRPPTEAEGKLSEILQKREGLRDHLEKLQKMEQQWAKEGGTLPFPGASVPFVCDALGEFHEELTDVGSQFFEWDSRFAVVSQREPPSPESVDQLGQQLKGAEAKLAELNFARARRRCDDEVQTLRHLEGRRRRILEEVLGGGLDTLEAVIRFSDLNGTGAPCRWTGDCRIPLLCTQGTCRGSLPIGRLKALLTRAHEGVVSLRGLRIGERPESARQTLTELEEEWSQVKKGLDELGWRDSARTWGRRYAREVAGRLKRVEEALETHRSQLAGPLLFVASAVRQDCSLCREQMEEAQETLVRLKETLAGANPLEAPTWVRHRAEELTRLEGNLEQLPLRIRRGCTLSRETAPVPPRALGWGALAMGMLALLWAAWFLPRSFKD